MQRLGYFCDFCFHWSHHSSMDCLSVLSIFVRRKNAHPHIVVALELLSTADCGCIDNDQLVAQTACRPAAPLPHYLQLRVAPFVKLEKPLFHACILWLFRLPAASARGLPQLILSTNFYLEWGAAKSKAINLCKFVKPVIG